ncbi:hypothetical protein [Cohnella lupini]|uniref:YqfQ-like protein n=1 Tax=Cohnella lupini TaxID=1294267 RepID=A0A3D9IMQ9_9BACL|nr:hypothetical protein [Cohnella lupini]RED63060.1 hypothetical protein DFP95_10453 [Cohnella lupini]
MNETHSPSTRSWTSGFGQEQFPGIEETFSGPPAAINPTTVLPAVQAEAPSSSLLSKLPFNISNISDVKALVDRMGGVEGILTTMGKFQKFMATMQQIAPMVKLFMGNKKGKGSSDSGSKKRTTRRRSVKRPSGAGKRRSRKTAKRR